MIEITYSMSEQTFKDKIKKAEDDAFKRGQFQTSNNILDILLMDIKSDSQQIHNGLQQPAHDKLEKIRRWIYINGEKVK